ncbi:MAG: hypothetical protein FWE63_06920 [Bacteroidales bacterium]|nr:hypothetical protein [Bacteroidales bacterium]
MSIAIILAICGIIIGAIATYLASKHFFNKGIKCKSLTPFIQYSSTLFSDIEPELQESLTVNYKNVKVDNITQIQFVIANTGDMPIRDIIRPLRMAIPVECKIFSVNIIHIEPEGREIKYTISETKDGNFVDFEIPLLNASEFFVFKMVVQDNLPSSEEDKYSKKYPYKFTITADELPPNLGIKHLPFSYYEQEKIPRYYDWSDIWGLLTIGAVLTAIVGVLLSLTTIPSLNIMSFRDFFKIETFSFYNVCILFLAIVGILLIIAFVVLFILAVSEIDIGKKEKPKIKIPKTLRKKDRFYLH